MDIEESKELLKKELVNTYSEKKAKAIEVLLNELDKKDKIINEMANKLKEHIKFCEQEAKGSLNNKICHISLKFDKSLLDIIESRR